MDIPATKESFFMVTEAEFTELRLIVHSLRDAVQGLKESFDRHEKRLYGNGQPGITEMVIRNQDDITDIRTDLESLEHPVWIYCL